MQVCRNPFDLLPADELTVSVARSRSRRTVTRNVKTPISKHWQLFWLCYMVLLAAHLFFGFRRSATAHLNYVL